MPSRVPNYVPGEDALAAHEEHRLVPLFRRSPSRIYRTDDRMPAAEHYTSGAC